MFFIRFLRYLKGYVRFTATGVFLERFLNIVVRKNINVWDVKKQETVLTACTDVRSYKRLRPYAKKTGVHLRVAQRFGAPFQARRYHKRVGLLVGVLFFVLFLCGMGQFIWRVEVVGNADVPTDEISLVANGMGLKTGAYKNKLDIRGIERALMMNIQRLSWVALNIDGSTATIEVRERVLPPEMFPDDDKPCNIIAAQEGVIVYMEVYEGQTVHKVGSVVQKGDVIVSGIIEDKQGHTTYKHSRAKVIALTDYEIAVEQPFVTQEKVFTGTRKHRRYLRIFGADLPLFVYRPFKVAYDLERSTKPLTLLGIPLPLTLLDETYDFYTLEQRPLTKEQAQAMAMAILQKKEEEELKGAEIVDKNVETTGNSNMHKLTVKYLCNIDIGKEQEILIN